jgi:outer membrane protein assembly factor BamB
LIALLPTLLLSAAVLQQPEQRQGVTVPLDRAIEDELATAREFLTGGQEDAAVAILQRILESAPSALVSSDDPDRLLGAAFVARKLLDGLGIEAQHQRDELVARQAELALAEALLPPNQVALQELAAQFAGTEVGDRATRALRDLALDRGFDLIDERSRAVFRIPTMKSLDDPSLPLVESRGLRPIWRFDFQDPLIAPNSRSHRITFGDGVGFVSNGVEVAALRLGDGEQLWSFAGPPGWQGLSQGDFEKIFSGYNPDMLTVPVLEDGILLVVLQEPFGIGRSDTFQRRRGWNDIDVRRQLPARRLYAFDADTGELLWQTTPSWLEHREGEPRGLVAAPPAAENGRVFLPLYDAVGTIDLSLQALDLYTGEPLWKTFLVSGQQETNLFGNILSEMASQPPIAADGQVYFSTNLGVIVALDAESGRTRWSRQYTRARVRTYQNGLESVRDETFANGAVAFDGERLFCAPSDSEQAFLIAPADGVLRGSWPYRDTKYGELRTLIGMTETGAWFHGTQLAFLPFPGSGERMRVSDSLFTRNGIPTSRHGAALARGEILAPANGSVEILDPNQLSLIARLQGAGTRPLELGPLQVAPGLAFVLRPGGITAFSSPNAILKSLAASDWDIDKVERLLPYLEGVDLSDPVIALKVADHAKALAQTAPNAELRERLALVAARGSFIAGNGPDALELLQPILSSTANQRRVRAAELALDVLERTDPTHVAMDRVLDILEADPNRRVLHFDGSLERKELALARARVLQTGKRDFGSEDHLDALLRLLMQDGLDNELQGQLNLAEWARLQVQRALRDPKLAARVERRARIAFDVEPASDSLMQRFAGTDTAWEWLRDKSRAVGNDRAMALRLASWSRGYAWPQAQGKELSLIPAELLVGMAASSSLPIGLSPLAQIDLGASRLLDFAVLNGRLLVLAQSDVNCFLVELAADGTHTSAPFRLAESRSALPDLRGRSFVHENGASLLLGDRWLLVPLKDEPRQEIRLSGSVRHVLRFGQLLALLCARGDGGIELEVRDLSSATRLLSMPLPFKDDRFHALAWTGDDLLILQDGTTQALRVPLFQRGQTETVPLIVGPGTHQLERLIPLKDGLVLPYTSAGRKALWLLRGDREEALLQRPQHDLRTFRAATGFGWLEAPLAPNPGEENGPILYWQGSEESSGRQFPFGSADIRFPQLESYSRQREDFATDRLLTAQESRNKGVLLRAWRLPRDGDPVESWTLALDDIPYDRLVGRLPAPVATDQGWLLPLKLLNSQTESPLLVMLLLSADGKLLGRLELEAPGNSSLRIEPVLGDGFAGLRHESRLYLLGGK